MASEPFRFLDLPIELRYMVYELIPSKSTCILHCRTRALSDVNSAVTTHRKVYRFARCDGSESDMTLVTKSLSPALLATSRAINVEAQTIFQPRLARLRASPTRVLINGDIRLVCSVLVEMSRTLFGTKSTNLLRCQCFQDNYELAALVKKAAAYTCFASPTSALPTTVPAQCRGLEICAKIVNMSGLFNDPNCVQARTPFYLVPFTTSFAQPSMPNAQASFSNGGDTPVEAWELQDRFLTRWNSVIDEFLRIPHDDFPIAEQLVDVLMADGILERDWMEGEES